MKLPRDLSGEDFVKALRRSFGYQVTRQVGRHIRLTTRQNGEHNITVPNHDPLKVGTLSGILSDVARHFNLTRDEVVERLFH